MRLRYCFIMMFAVVTIARGQVLPKPVAHYPLDVTIINRPSDLDKQWVLRPFDVSGNGKHGTFTNSKAFAPQAFPGNNFSYIMKAKTDDARLNIPDPYHNYNFSQGFAITFWMYWDGVGTEDVLVAVPKLKVSSQNGNIILTTHVASTPVSYSLSLGAVGWYFVAISADASDVLMYKYALTGTYDAASSAMDYSAVTIGGVPGTFLTTSQLLDQQFTGSVANVRFFKKYLTTSEVNDYRNTDYYWSQKNFDYEHRENFSFEAGTYSKYLLDNPQDNYAEEEIGRLGAGELDGVINNFTPRANRFDEAAKAINFSTDGSVDLNATVYDDLKEYFNGYDGKHGLTISFWTYVSSTLSHNEDGNYPFLATDDRFSIFYGTDNSNKHVFGIDRIKDILGVWRTVKDHPEKSWLLWYNKPANLTTVGWYQVVLVYEPKIMKVLIIPYGGTLTGGFCYFGMEDQDVYNVKNFGFGIPPAAEGNRKAIQVLDDVRIYNWPLTMADVDALNHAESDDGSSGGGARMMADNDDNETEGGGDETQALTERTAMIYPNPATSELTLDLGAPQESTLIVFEDAMGRTVYSKYHSTDTGLVNFQNVKSITGSAGLYFIKVQTNSSLVTHKLIVN